MDEIIMKYRGKTKDGYVFPVMDDEKAREYSTKDYLFKKFRERVNIWLKVAGVELGAEYSLYAYVFRHTAITVALDNNLPVPYVATGCWEQYCDNPKTLLQWRLQAQSTEIADGVYEGSKINIHKQNLKLRY